MTLDDAMKSIPDGWDFNIGRDWDGDTGQTVYHVTLMERCLGEKYHRGHYGKQVEAESAISVIDALQKALTQAAT